MKKRMLTILLAVCMLAGSVPQAGIGVGRVDAKAAVTGKTGSYAETSGGITWYYNETGSGVEIVGADLGDQTEIVIPESFTLHNETAFVESIGQEAFKECGQLTSVTFPSNSRISQIRAGAFEDCAGLGSVVFQSPSYIQEIGENAFKSCGFSSIDLPASLETIGAEAFAYGSLASVTIPEVVSAIGRGVFANCTSLETISVQEGNSRYVAGETINAILSQDGLLISTNKNGVIPDGTKTICEWALFGCPGLTKLTIPDSVTKIEDNAISFCSELTELKISEYVTDIDQGAICNCRKLNKITVDKENGYFYDSNGKALIESIGDNLDVLLVGCEGVSIPFGVGTIGKYAFPESDNLTNIVIPPSVTMISEYAFSNCICLESITLPLSLRTVGPGAFQGCSSLKTVKYAGTETDWSETVTVNGDNKPLTDAAFTFGHQEPVPIYDPESEVTWSCIMLPDGTFSIDGRTAFAEGKTEVTVPGALSGVTVTSIGENAFEHGTNLKEISLPGEITTIEKHAFAGCTSLTKLEIPESVEEIGEGITMGCHALSEITVNGSNQIYRSTESVGSEEEINAIIKNDGNKLIAGCRSTEIPEGVTCIGAEAFKHIKYLGAVTLPQSLTAIEDDAFYGCQNLQAVEIPDKVTAMGENAFRDCKGLVTVALPSALEELPSSVFNRCSSLASVEIPSGVKHIGDSAFMNCNALGFVKLHDGIESIGGLAFANCTALDRLVIPESLQQIGNEVLVGSGGSGDIYVYYVGTPKQWNEITNIENAFDDERIKISFHYMALDDAEDDIVIYDREGTTKTVLPGEDATLEPVISAPDGVEYICEWNLLAYHEEEGADPVEIALIPSEDERSCTVPDVRVAMRVQLTVRSDKQEQTLCYNIEVGTPENTIRITDETEREVPYGGSITLRPVITADAQADYTCRWDSAVYYDSLAQGAEHSCTITGITQPASVTLRVTDKYGNERQLCYFIGVSSGLSLTEDEENRIRKVRYGDAVTLSPEIGIAEGAGCEKVWDVFYRDENQRETAYENISLSSSKESCTVRGIRRRLYARLTVRDDFGVQKSLVYMLEPQGDLIVQANSDPTLLHEVGDAVTLTANVYPRENIALYSWSAFYRTPEGDEQAYPEEEIAPSGLSCRILHVRPHTRAVLTVTDKQGNIASDAFEVNVNSALIVSGSMENTVYVTPGEDARLEVFVKARPKNAGSPQNPSSETLSAEREGGEKTITWYQVDERGEHLLPDENAETLELLSCREPGEYRCHITDENGVLTVVTYYVKMNDGLTCDYEDEDNTIYVYEGKDVTIAPHFTVDDSLTDDDYTTLTCTWYRTDSGFRIMGTLQEDQDFFNVEKVEGTQYLKVMVKNAYSVVTERNFKVIPTTDMRINGTLQEKVGMKKGVKTSLYTDVVCKPLGNVRFEWYDVTDQNEIRLLMQNLTADENGRVRGKLDVPTYKKEYKCTVTDVDAGEDAAKTETKTFSAYIDSGLRILSKTGGGKVLKNDPVEFKVNAVVDKDYNLFYQWKNTEEEEPISVETSVLSISSATRSGDYQCTVRDDVLNSETVPFEVKIDNGFSVGDIHAGAIFKKHNPSVREIFSSVGLSVNVNSSSESDIEYLWYHAARYDSEEKEYVYLPVGAEAEADRGHCMGESGAYKVEVRDKNSNNKEERYYYLDRYVYGGLLSAGKKTLRGNDPKAFYYYEIKPEKMANCTLRVSSEQKVNCYLYDANWSVMGQNELDHTAVEMKRILSGGERYYVLLEGDGSDVFDCDINLSVETIGGGETGGGSGSGGNTGNPSGGSGQTGAQPSAAPGKAPADQGKLSLPKISLTLAKKNEIKLTITNYSKGASYEIYRSTDGKKYSKLKTISAATYTDKKLKNGKTYYYKVCGVSGGEKTGYSDFKSKKIVTSLKKPSIKAVRKGKKYSIEWKKVPNATEYLVQYKVGKAKYKVLKKLKAKKTSADITKVLVGKSGTIRFKVTAVYKSGKVSVTKDSKELVAKK